MAMATAVRRWPGASQLRAMLGSGGQNGAYAPSQEEVWTGESLEENEKAAKNLYIAQVEERLHKFKNMTDRICDNFDLAVNRRRNQYAAVGMHCRGTVRTEQLFKLYTQVQSPQGTNIRSFASGPRGTASGGQLRSPLSRLAVEGVQDIIAVASGKGGVGKSTTAVNLAVALALECKLRVGLLDADVYGPSIPTLMKLNGRPHLDAESKMLPLENFGVRCMSMGFLMEKDAPAVWRGPMVMSALEKLMRGTAWGKIDVMVVDMPPGTGDAQISISQRLPLAGAVIVSTPQDLALVDARRGVTMFQKVDVPILGLIENMSFFKCPRCGENTNVFGHGGGQQTAKEMNMEFLGEVPLNITIRETSDFGTPIVASAPDSELSIVYKTIARRIEDKLKELASSDDSAGPKFVIK